LLTVVVGAKGGKTVANCQISFYKPFLPDTQLPI